MKHLLQLFFCGCLCFLIASGRVTHNRARPPRIPEGEIAKPNQFPYQAMLVDTSTKFQRFFCSAAILDGQTVVTAAFCVNDRVAKHVSVAYGDILLKPHHEISKAGKIIIHPNFNEATKENDIAIIKLKTSMKFSKRVAGISIIDRPVRENEKLIFSGWGAQANNMEKDLLLFTDNFIVDPECSGYINLGVDSMCAKSQSLTGCAKDEGSLLVLPNAGLVGIYSYGVDVCRSDTPNVFVDAYYHHEWILEVKEQPFYDYE